MAGRRVPATAVMLPVEGRAELPPGITIHPDMAASDRAAAALWLRWEGWPVPAIKDACQYPDTRATLEAIAEAVSAIGPRDPETERTVDLGILDALLHLAMTAVRAGIWRAIDPAIRVLERRARLMGYDAPTRTEAQITVTTDDEYARARDELASLISARAQRQLVEGEVVPDASIPDPDAAPIPTNTAPPDAP